MKRRIVIYLIILVTLLSTSCNNIVVKTNEKSGLATQTISYVISTFIPSKTVTPFFIGTATVRVSSTLLRPTLTLTSILIPTETPDAKIEVNCSNVLPEFPKEPGLTGTLILEDSTGIGDDYFMDVTTWKKSPIIRTEHVYPNDYAVSPNGNWLAYTGAAYPDSVQYSLLIQSADGKQKMVLPYKEGEWSFISYWLNDQWLALLRVNRGAALDTLILFNPFTRQKQVLTPNYPDIYGDDYNFGGWATLAIYDPTQTLVVYLGINISNTTMKLVLRDLHTEEAIFELNNYRFNHFPPQWSPDGMKFIFVQGFGNGQLDWKDEFVMINKEGNISTLTHLTALYKHTILLSYQWSPDSRYIAFWLRFSLTMDIPPQYYFAVLDMVDQVVTRYCIPTDESIPALPVWSQDNRHVAIGVTDPNDKSNKVIIVDIVEGYAVQIAEGFTPEGWLK